MAFLALVVGFLTNIMSPLGMLMLLGYLMEGMLDSYQFVIAGIAAAIGLVFGFVSWDETVEPRLFWVRSDVELLDSRIGASLTYAIKFFFSAFLIIGLIELFC